MQRIALISDLHGNAIALREVLRAIERRGVDEIVCLGDVATLGAAPGEVIETLQRRRIRCIRGNHDDYVLDASLVDDHCGPPMIQEAIDWCRGELSHEHLEFVRGFESGLEIPLENGQKLLLYHGSPGSNLVDLWPETPPDALDELLGTTRAAVMAGGHTHLQMLRQHRGIRVVNPGSVGAPFREAPLGGIPVILDHAEYASVEVDAGSVAVALHRVALDRRELATAVLASRNPMRAALAATYL